MYTAYSCYKCKKEFVLIAEDLEKNIHEGKYITCPYCGTKKLKRYKTSDSIKECMQAGEIDLNKL